MATGRPTLGSGPTVAYTDGACRGNPGPGGWAWAVEGGPWASGAAAETTNQRMEITAVAEAVAALDGPLVVRSDSTYVVHCWRDRWWQGWLKRGWRNSKKEPVANRDLWEPLVEVFRTRDDLVLEWVKGHGGDPMNDLVDRLAVRASWVQHGDAGHGTPPPEALGPPDRAGRGRSAGAAGTGVPVPASGPVGASVAVAAGDPVRARDGRVPEGWRLVVTGLRPARGVEVPGLAARRATLAQILAAQRELHPDLVVVTGLRAGAEELGARAASDAGVPYVAVLPYPDPAAGRPESARRDFEALLDGAEQVVVLERRRPVDVEGRRAALARRDGWLRSAASAAVVVTDGRDPEAELLLRRYEESVGEELWTLDL